MTERDEGTKNLDKAPTARSETPMERLRHLSRREYFAGCALTAILVQRGIFEKQRATAVLDAWAIADEMIASCDAVESGE